MKTKKRKDVEKVLGEPVFMSFTDEVYKTRRNLIVFSFIALAYKLSGATIKSVAPLGISFEGVGSQSIDGAFIDKAFFFILLYSLCHFISQSWEALGEWRVRITGTRTAFKTTAYMGDSNADYPDEPRQSSLMNWWHAEAKKMNGLSGLSHKISNSLEAINSATQHLTVDPSQGDLVKAINGLKTEVKTLNERLEQSERILKSPRILISLQRFERWYKHFSYSQLVRWFILEWGFPIGLALVALCLLFPWDLRHLICTCGMSM